MTQFVVPGAGVLDFHIKNVDASIYITNLDHQTTESLLWELFVRCGPLHSVQIHRDKVANSHLGSASVEFRSSKDADYATLIMNSLKLYGRSILVKKSQSSTTNQTYIDPTVTKYDGLVRLRVSNLAPEVTEYDFRSIFGKFGPILRTDLPTDKDNGERLSFGFITYQTFETGDAVVTKMNKQYLSSRQIAVEYAIKNSETGERYGNQTDRLLLAKAEENNITLLPDVDLSTLSGIGNDTLSTSSQIKLTSEQVNNNNNNNSNSNNSQLNNNQQIDVAFDSNNNMNMSKQPTSMSSNQQQSSTSQFQPPPMPPGASINNMPMPPMMFPNSMFGANNQYFNPNMPPPPPASMVSRGGPGMMNPMTMNPNLPNMMNAPGGPGMMNPMMFNNLTPQEQQNFLLSFFKNSMMQGGGVPNPMMNNNINMGLNQQQRNNGPPIHPQFGPPPPWVQNPQQYQQWVQQMSSGNKINF